LMLFSGTLPHQIGLLVVTDNALLR
jgi:hypothetical protein